MTLPKHAVRWAEDYIRERRHEFSEKGETPVDEFLANELKSYEEPFFISETMICAVEISKGGEPVDARTVTHQLNQKAIETLDQVVIQGGRFDDAKSFCGLTLERASKFQHSGYAPKVTSYAKRIHETNGLAAKFHSICNDDTLAGSLLRLLAIRKSRRLWLIHKELESHSGKDWDVRSLSRLDAKVAKLLGERTWHIRSFLSQLDAEASYSPPVLPPPAPPRSPPVSIFAEHPWLFLLFIAGCVFFGLLLPNRGSDNKSRSRYQPPNTVKPDPMAGYRTVQKYGAKAAFEEYLDNRATLSMLSITIRALKAGIVSEDEKAFVQGKKILNSASVKQEAVDRYSDLRTSAMEKRRSSPRSDVELLQAMQPEWAAWFDSLPTCEDANDHSKKLSTTKKVTLIELDTLKKWKKEHGLTDEVLQILNGSKQK